MHARTRKWYRCSATQQQLIGVCTYALCCMQQHAAPSNHEPRKPLASSAPSAGRWSEEEHRNTETGLQFTVRSPTASQAEPLSWLAARCAWRAEIARRRTHVPRWCLTAPRKWWGTASEGAANEVARRNDVYIHTQGELGKCEMFNTAKKKCKSQSQNAVLQTVRMGTNG